jgi:hypothetical protein
MHREVTVDVDPVARYVLIIASGGVAPYVADAAPSGDIAGYRVRTAWAISGAAHTGMDGDAPLNNEIRYIITDYTGASVVSGPVTVPSDVPILSDSTDPTRAIPVTVASQRPNRWQARSVWFDILGSRAPFATVAPMRLREGLIKLWVPDRAARAAMIDLVGAGNPLTLRAVCPDAVDDLILLPASAEEDSVLTDDHAGPVLFGITYQAISRELGPYTADPARTYAQLLTQFATYGDVLLAYPTYAALLTGDQTAGLGVETLIDGSFPAGPVAPWSTTRTEAGLVWSGTATALVTAPAGPAPLAAFLSQLPLSQPIPAGSTVLRVTGKIRSTAVATGVRCEVVSNTSPAIADYGQPGASGASAAVPITSVGVWGAFAVEIATASALHDVYSLYIISESLALGAAVELDDLSARWLLPA